MDNMKTNTENKNQYEDCEITADAVIEDLKKWISMSVNISEPVFIHHIILQRILDLINRQKAEIERLQIAKEEAYSSGFGVGKITGIKEFAKRFENNIKDVRVTLGQTWEIQNALKKTLKELTDFKE